MSTNLLLGVNTFPYRPCLTARRTKKLLIILSALFIGILVFFSLLPAQTAQAEMRRLITPIQVQKDPAPGNGSFADWGTYNNITNNTVAYCLQWHKGFPESMIQTCDTVFPLAPQFNAVFYYGYGYGWERNNHTIEGVELNADEARAVTQMATWIVQGAIESSSELYKWNRDGTCILKGTTDTYDPRWNYGARVVDTAVALANKALSSYQGLPTVAMRIGTPVESPHQHLMVVLSSVEVRFTKTSAQASWTSNNSAYSLEGARFEIRDTHEQTVATITFDARGTTEPLQLEPHATYTAVEIAAPQGFVKLTEPVRFTTDDKTTSVTLTNQPQYVPVSVVLKKLDQDSGQTTPQGDASLTGAQFSVSWYKGVYTSEQELPTSADATWTLSTNEQGEATWASADGNPYTIGDQPVFPLGTVKIKEINAPEGYTLNPGVYVLPLSPQADASSPSLALYKTPTVTESVLHGELILQKVDAESYAVWTDSQESPLPTATRGSASLAGARFGIENASNQPVLVSGTWYEPGASLAELTTNEQGRAQMTLPYGSYRVAELTAPSAYTLMSPKSIVVQVHPHETQQESFTYALPEQVIRGDIAFNKVDEQTMEALAQVPFKLTSKTTGESHILVTDKNGMASTHSSWNAHSTKTNANDLAVSASGIIDEDLLDPSAGIWFSGLEADSVYQAEPTDELGALPFDVYELEELPCHANQGKALIKRSVTITRHLTTLDLGTIDNKAVEITTSFSAATGEKTVPAGNVELIDHVHYENLTPNKVYTLTCTIMDKTTGALLRHADGSIFSQILTFEPTEYTGTVDVVMTFDTSQLKGHELVAFEQLSLNGNLVAAHEDIQSTTQLITVEDPKQPPRPEEPVTPTPQELPRMGVDDLVESSVLFSVIAVSLVLMSYALRLKKRAGH